MHLVGFIIRSIWVIKSGRMRGVGHVTHMGGIMDAYKVLLGKLTEKDNFEDTDFNKRIILKLILMKYNEGMGWIHLCWDRDK